MTNNIDLHIGNKIHARRSALGMTQANLGKQLGMSFQQIQKYEKGKNKISAGQLYKLSLIMSVQITYFFEGYNDKDVINIRPLDKNERAMVREAIALVKTYNGINNPHIKKSFLHILKTIASIQC